jgi:16S rRNA (guanine(966)-N(2))-methyltransferase RsmD
VRIAAGRWKGRRLEVPRQTRPTSGRAREALFDILQKRVRGSRLLDLYAGSGAVGIEAVSRGAARAVLVESSAAHLEAALLRLAPEKGSVEILPLPAPAAVAELARRGERFEIVFVDPPYADGGTAAAVSGAARLLTEEGMLVVQTDADASAPRSPAGLVLAQRRAYGRNVFWFFR